MKATNLENRKSWSDVKCSKAITGFQFYIHYGHCLENPLNAVLINGEKKNNIISRWAIRSKESCLWYSFSFFMWYKFHLDRDPWQHHSFFIPFIFCLNMSSIIKLTGFELRAHIMTSLGCISCHKQCASQQGLRNKLYDSHICMQPTYLDVASKFDLNLTKEPVQCGRN